MTTDPTVVLIGVVALTIGLIVLKQVADVLVRLIIAITGVAVLYGLIIYFDLDLGPVKAMLQQFASQFGQFITQLLNSIF